MKKRTCARCKGHKAMRDYKYCGVCAAVIRRLMVRDGYLTPLPEPRRPRDAKGRRLDVSDHD